MLGTFTNSQICDFKVHVVSGSLKFITLNINGRNAGGDVAPSFTFRYLQLHNKPARDA